ncbi:MAG: hypothetical protein WCA53_13020 [Caballeronia sp.]
MFCQSIATASGYNGSLDGYSLIATLGPSGTSSENTAMFFRQKLHSNPEIKLFPTYEDAEKFVFLSEGSLILVANAYKRINEFYISNRIKPLLSFFFNTPPYGIATKPGVDLAVISDKRALRVASHHAPQHLIAQLLPYFRFEVIDAASTGLAAEMTSQGLVDACHTPKTACLKQGLQFQSDEVNIQMLWTAFSRNKSQ